MIPKTMTAAVLYEFVKPLKIEQLEQMKKGEIEGHIVLDIAE